MRGGRVFRTVPRSLPQVCGTKRATAAPLLLQLDEPCLYHMTGRSRYGVKDWQARPLSTLRNPRLRGLLQRWRRLTPTSMGLINYKARADREAITRFWRASDFTCDGT